uniref:ShKT domain-containing protein n=1 Tax=Panagrellus redivivus TaxID=6233 RepID=A0A7E4W331_PANRE
MATPFFTKALTIVAIACLVFVEVASDCVDSSVVINCSKRVQYCNSEEWIVVMNRFCAATCGFCTNSTTAAATAATAKVTTARPTVPVATSLMQQAAATSQTSSWGLPSWLSSIGSPKTAILASQDAAGSKNFGYFSF